MLSRFGLTISGELYCNNFTKECVALSNFLLCYCAIHRDNDSSLSRMQNISIKFEHNRTQCTVVIIMIDRSPPSRARPDQIMTSSGNLDLAIPVFQIFFLVTFSYFLKVFILIPGS